MLHATQAADSKAAGNPAHALEIITAIRAQQPQHARAHFAAGQLHADLQQWQLAEEAYVAGASLEADLAQRARCHLGAGELPRGTEAAKFPFLAFYLFSTSPSRAK